MNAVGTRARRRRGTGGHGFAPCPRAPVPPYPRGIRALALLFLCAAVPAAFSACGGAERGGIASATMAADSADQLIWGLTTILTKDGVREAYLSADTAYEYDAPGRVDMVGVKVTFYSADGVPESVLTGKQGTYWTRTNQMSARDDVIIVRQSDGARLRTNFIEYDPSQNQVRTDKPYVADKGAQHISGVGFVCDPAFVNCTSQQTHGNAGRLVMPGR
jgi:LPS export ABC transporter protein LptC